MLILDFPSVESITSQFDPYPETEVPLQPFTSKKAEYVQTVPNANHNSIESTLSDKLGRLSMFFQRWIANLQPPSMNPRKNGPSLLRRIAGWQPHIDRKAILIELVVRVDHRFPVYDVFWLGTDIAVSRAVERAVTIVNVVLGKRPGLLPSLRSSWRQRIWNVCESFDPVGEHRSCKLAMRSEVQYSRAGWLHRVVHCICMLTEAVLVVLVRLVCVLCLPHVEHGS